MRVKLKIDPECEETLWGLASRWESAAFLLASGTLAIGFVLLISYMR